MEFLVEIAVEFPPHFTDEQRDELIAEERTRGRVLASQGILRSIWQVPGQFANRAIWSAEDATQLHRAITTLPLRRNSTVNVTPLASHDLAPNCLGIPATLSVPDNL